MGSDKKAESATPPSLRGGPGARAWRELRETYVKEGIVLVLGAGVSKDSGIPSWDGLLENLLEKLNERADQPTVERLRNHDMSLPMVASVIEQRFGRDRKDFVEDVRKALYRDFSYFDRVRKRRDAFVRDVRRTNSTLHAVCTLCAVKGEPRSIYVSNPRIGAIVTFNIDQLVQSYIRSRFSNTLPSGERPKLVRTVERASAGPHAQSKSKEGAFVPRRINIYHLHGYLRFDHGAGEPGKETNKITLTEQDYFDVFNDPMSIFNYTFLHLLREWTCLFIGLSMQDENIRRLLHYSAKERMESLRAEGRDPKKVQEKWIRHFAILRQEGSDVDKAREESLRLLGTKVLWVEEYPEIAAELELMYKGTGDDWGAVS
jgi:hypothetical protein